MKSFYCDIPECSRYGLITVVYKKENISEYLDKNKLKTISEEK